MKNPFTHTPGSAGDALIDTEKEDILIENFNYDIPPEFVYKICGVRGSGKTVILGNVLRYFKQDERKKAGWLAYDLSSTRDPLKTLISYLSLLPEMKKLVGLSKASIAISLPFASAGIDANDTFYDDEVILEQMLRTLIERHKKILIVIDDIAKTKEMTDFCSVYAKLIRNTTRKGDKRPWPLYLICSGVYKNLYELGEVANLTFFKRAAEIKTEALSLPAMTIKYELKLNIDEERAKELAVLTKGFAYAYQVLGSTYFDNGGEDFEKVLKIAKSDLFSHCYEKIWSELPEGEREIMRIIAEKPMRRQDVLERMKNKGSYQVNSNNLRKQGLLVDSKTAYGMAEILLPFFGEYIIEYT